MKKLNFLSSLKEEGKLSAVDSSEEIAKAYLIKSDKCIRVAKLAFLEGIYENSVSEAYYSIYNTIMSLFFRCGIKCENHSASAILLKEIFELRDLCEIFLEFKKDRIDNQYYLPVSNGESMTGLECDKKIKIAENFILQMRSYIGRLGVEEVRKFYVKFKEFLERLK